MKLDELHADPHNRRKHNPRNLGMLADALRKVGASRSIVIDETGEILAGNGVVAAASEVGLSEVQVVDVDGETVVAVRRSGLSAEQKRELAIYDNRTAELAEWDWERLAQDQAEGLALEPWWTSEEFSCRRRLGAPIPMRCRRCGRPRFSAGICSNWARIGCCAGTRRRRRTWRG